MMKTRIQSFSKRSLSMVLAILMMFSILMVGTITANAKNGYVNAGNLYFIKPSTWTNGVEILVQQENANWSVAYPLTQLQDNLYYINIDNTVDGYMRSGNNPSIDYCFIDETSWGGEGNSMTGRRTYANHYTATSTYGYNNSSGFYLTVPASGSNDAALTSTYNASRDTLMKKAQTATVYTGSSSSTTGGSVSLTGYYFTANDALASSSSSSSYSGVIGTNMTMSATANAGYVFDGYYKSTTFNSTNKLSSDTTYTYEISGTKTIYPRFKTETQYAITIARNNNDYGTVGSASMNVGATAQTLPTATPNYGYRFVNWTATTGITITNSTSASGATITATRAGTVTANFEKITNKNLYLVGRFRKYNKISGTRTATYVGGSEGAWSTTAENIPFTYDSSSGYYYVNTYSKLSEVSAKLSNEYQYFQVYDKDESKNWRLSSNQELTASNEGTKYTTADSGDCNFYFNTTNTDGPVTIWFDTVTQKLWFTYKRIVKVGTSTNGSVYIGTSANPTTTTTLYVDKNATVYLANSPSAHYQLSYYKKGSTNIGAGSSTTITDGCTITGVFTNITHTATVSTHTNGSLTVAGNSTSATVNEATSYNIVATPNDGYQLSDVTVNGTSILPSGDVGATTATTIARTMGNSDETVVATFTARTYSISYADTNASHTTKPTTGTYGSTVNFSVNVASGYSYDAPTATYVDKNGATQTLTLTNVSTGNYRFTMPAGPVTITTVGYKTYYTSTISASGHGSVDPSGSTNIPGRDGISVTATPDANYHFKEWQLSTGVAQEGSDTVVNGVHTALFKATQDGVTITAVFEEDKYTVTSSRNDTSYGSVTPASINTVGVETTGTFTATPNTGYKVANWTVTSGTVVVNGIDYSSTGTDTIPVTSSTLIFNAKSAANIRVNFEAYSHGINITATNATVTANKSSYILDETVTLTVTPAAGYTVSKSNITVTLDGSTPTISGSAVTYNSSGSFTFTVPAKDSSADIGVSVTAVPITPSVRVTYHTDAALTTTTTKTASTSNTSGTTTARDTETIQFYNKNKYPSGTIFTIKDGTTTLLSSNTSTTTSISRKLSAGTHTLKVEVSFAGQTLSSGIVTLTVNNYYEINYLAHEHGNLSSFTLSYTNEFGTAATYTTDTTATLYAKAGTTVSFSNITAGAGTLIYGIKKDGEFIENTSYSFSISANTSLQIFTQPNVYLLGLNTDTDHWWDQDCAKTFKYTADSGIYEIRVSLVPGDYYFKVLAFGDYFSLDQSNGGAWTDEVDWATFYTENGNSKFTATTTGVYIFKWDSVNHTFYAEMPRNPHNITYSGSNCSWTGAPATVVYKDTASFTPTASSGYRITGVTATYVDGSSATQTLTVSESNGTYSFSMPDYDVSVTINTIARYTVTYSSSGAGITGISGKHGASSATSAFTSPGTFDAGEKVSVTAALSPGYMLDTSTSTIPSGWTADTVYTGKVKTTNLNANANVVLKAKKIDYTLSKSITNVSGASIQFTNTSGSTIQTAQVGTAYKVVITIPSKAYTISALTVTGADVDEPVLSNNGLTYTYSFTLDDDQATEATENNNNTIQAAATLVATKPTVTVNTNVIEVYAGQSFDVDDFVTKTVVPDIQVTYTYTFKNAAYNSGSNMSNNNGEFTAPTDLIKRSGDEIALTIVATNNPGVVSAVDSDVVNLTVYVNYTSAQLSFLALKDTYLEMGQEESRNYDTTQPEWTAYTTAVNNAVTALGSNPIGSAFPAYNAQTPTSEHLESLRAALEDAYDAIDSIAKRTTVYALVGYKGYVYAHAANRETSGNKEFETRATPVGTNGDTAKCYEMTYEATVQVGDSPKHLYSFTFYGATDVIVYLASQEGYSIGVSGEDDWDRKLSGDIKTKTQIYDNNQYKKWYVDLKNNSPSQNDNPDITLNLANDQYVPLSVSLNNTYTKQTVSSEEYTLSALETFLGDTNNKTPSGSLVSSGAIIRSTYRIEPVGAGNTVEVTETKPWGKKSGGEYHVYLKAHLGETAESSDYETALSSTYHTVKVISDTIRFYFDMNGSVGVPTIYFTNPDNNETIPYEADLVDGSESIYMAEAVVPNILDEVGGQMSLNENKDLTIAKISVDGQNYHDTSGNQLQFKAKVANSSTLWLRANSSSLTKFDIISYSSATATVKANIPGTAISDITTTGIVNEDVENDYETYKITYAKYVAADSGIVTLSKFPFKLSVTAGDDIPVGNSVKYFDAWNIPSGAGGTAKYYNLSILSPLTNNYTYTANYGDTSDQKRVEIIYKFNDYDTSDGNYVFDYPEAARNNPTLYQNKLVPNTYTKMVKVDNFNNLASDAKTNAPKIRSNYFDYSVPNNPEYTVTEDLESTANKKVITVQMNQTPHRYKITAGSNTYTGFYQQTKKIDAGDGKYWEMTLNNSVSTTVSTGRYYTARFAMYQSSETLDGETFDCATFTAVSGTGSVDKKSVIVTSHYELIDDATKVKHNFYIVDYLAGETADNRTLVGGGVVYATTDSSGIYRTADARTTLGTGTAAQIKTNIGNYVSGILGGTYNSNNQKITGGNFGTEFPAQTIANIGFKYLPYAGNEDVYRYSDLLGAYMYTYGMQFTNNYEDGRKLRVYSYYIYKDSNDNKYLVISDTYAEVTIKQTS